MHESNRHDQQLSLEDLIATSPRWKELTSETREEVVELLAQILREHVAPGAEASDE
jgi:hypothetical protein